MNVNLVKLMVLVLAGLAVMACGCDQLSKKVPGNIAGVILDENGTGQGYMSIQLVDVASNRTIQTQTSEDSGSYFFKQVEPGTYIIKTLSMGGYEVPNDCPEFDLSLGRTMQMDITITKTQKPAEE